MWDLALDPATGDFLFDSRKDIGGVTGDAIIDQRILTRCKIPRGTFKMDEDGTLGSTLHLLARFHSDQETDNSEAIAAVEEALEPMDDITVNEIVVQLIHETDDPVHELAPPHRHQRLIHVHWSNATAEGEPLEEEVISTPSFETVFSTD